MTQRWESPAPAHTFPVWSAKLGGGEGVGRPHMVMLGRETYHGFIVDHRILCDSKEQAQAVYRALADATDRIATLTEAIRFGDDAARMAALRESAA